MFDYYEDSYEPENECRHCKKTDKSIAVAQEYLVEILEMLYSKNNLDIAKLDDVLGDLCHQLDVTHLPATLPNVTRPDNLKSWIESNNNYLKALA